MGKMIVTIGGGSENKEASVSSGKLLIEVRDERSSRDPGKPRRSKLKKFRENDTDEEAFDPDTLERGLGGGGVPKHSQVRCLGQGEGLGEEQERQMTHRKLLTGLQSRIPKLVINAIES